MHDVQNAADPALPPASAHALPRATREAIVLVTLLQGLLVYGWLQKWWGDSAAGTAIGLTTVLAVPAWWVLCVQQLRDRVLWQGTALVTLLVLALNTSVWWIADGDPRNAKRLWAGWLLSQQVLLLVLLAWMQVALQHRQLRRVPYSSLFAQAWNNAMVLPMVALFVGLCWSVLGLWASLFLVLGVSLFMDTFTQPAFACMATGLMLGLGVLVARGQPRALRMLLQLVLGLCKLLLPLIALVVVLFVLFLPFTGVRPLWDTGRATVLLCTLLLQLMLGCNAVFQDGRHGGAVYPQPVQWLVQAAVCCMPLLALLAVWGLGLRVQQYGWSVARIWGAAVVGLLLLYSLGYAWGVLRPRSGPWLGSLARTNPPMSWLLVAVLVLWHAPGTNPYRISAQDQARRMLHGTAPVTLKALQGLRFDHGRYGRPALESLLAHPRMADATTQQWLQQLLSVQRRADMPAAVPQAQAVAPAPADGRAWPVAPGHTAPPQDWWVAMATSTLKAYANGCDAAHQRCMVLQLPLLAPGDAGSEQADGRDDGREGAQDVALANPLLCVLGMRAPRCQVFARNAQGQWESPGRLQWYGLDDARRAQLERAITEGQLTTQPARWLDVQVPGMDVPAASVRN